MVVRAAFKPALVHVAHGATALVVFAHGSRSSHLNPRNMMATETMNAKGIATFLFDLLTVEEEDQRFDIALLAKRLIGVIRWIDREHEPQRPIAIAP